MEEHNASHTLPPSTAARPDLDWSQVRETILMLNLAVAQIEIALKDSSGSVDVLAESFTGMYGNIMALVEQARALPDSPAKAGIEASGMVVSEQMQQAIIAFQFYDRLSTLQQQIRSQYTMEDEKLMFDTLIRTGDVREALARYVEARQQQSGSGADVELF
ncbi:MAG: hypothetical protein MUE86_02975 [Thiobacillaceae bacterium]|nr:hypothetical protein [Thiobacillaceae bacterium]